MKNLAVPLPLAAAAVLITGLLVSIATKPAGVFAQDRSSYAEDRAAIEDFQARYLFALDFHDPDLYVSTFTEDGVLDYGSGEVKGRQGSATTRMSWLRSTECGCLPSGRSTTKAGMSGLTRARRIRHGRLDTNMLVRR